MKTFIYHLRYSAPIEGEEWLVGDTLIAGDLLDRIVAVFRRAGNIFFIEWLADE